MDLIDTAENGVRYVVKQRNVEFTEVSKGRKGIKEGTKEHRKEGTKEHRKEETKERRNEQTNVRTNERTKV